MTGTAAPDPRAVDMPTREPSSSFVRLAATTLGLLALAGAGAAGYRAGQAGVAIPDWIPTPISGALDGRSAPAAPTGPVIYYRDPDGRASYSLGPRRTSDGREFAPVRASEDVSFQEVGKVATDDAAKAGKRVSFYRNPMGLPDISPVPKKDSMGMDYIPVIEGEDDDAGVVKVSPGKIQRTGVRTEKVELRIVSRPVRVPGTVQLDERRVTVVSTRSEAFVDKVANVTTGDRVARGQPLVDVYSPEINAAAAQLIANPGFDGSRRRLRNLNVPAEAIAEMERSRKVPAAVTWSAPRDGLILERNAVEGMRAGAGDMLFRIGDVSVVWVLADVPEHELGDVRVGQAAVVRVRSLPGRTFGGTVGLVYPQVNKETRTIRVRIELANPEGILLPDMYADVDLVTGDADPVLAVPEDSVIDTGARKVVLVEKGEGRFEPREVSTGERGGGLVRIRQGLSAGETVVTSANFLIDAESNLKSALRGMSAASSTSDGEKPR